MVISEVNTVHAAKWCSVTQEGRRERVKMRVRSDLRSHSAMTPVQLLCLDDCLCFTSHHSLRIRHHLSKISGEGGMVLWWLALSKQEGSWFEPLFLGTRLLIVL